MDRPDTSHADHILATHERLLQKWRKAMDLVGPGPVEPHFEDARGAVIGLPVEGEWADLGSGAGFPGIALAAFHPDAHIILVESRQKRSIFLNKVVGEAKMTNIEVRCTRTETLPDGSLNGVISRAYKPPLAFLEDAARLLRPGGHAVMMLGDGAQVDVPNHWSEASRSRYAVADGFRERVVLVYQPQDTP
jgi:16S rRNA (guanine(527)-N(7))-methyltransferase RsmG